MSERTQYAITFLETIKDAGYDVCIYGNLKTFLLMLDMQQLEDYSKWFAGYTDTPYFPYEMDMWQYTDTGRVDGIPGNVDINIRFLCQ
jgi:GH25 family lysozyme M1 (1,4-beta-N-acetylmuramidase)